MLVRLDSIQNKALVLRYDRETTPWLDLRIESSNQVFGPLKYTLGFETSLSMFHLCSKARFQDPMEI